MQHVHDVKNGRSGHQDYLENPEAEVGDRGEGVVADVVAARLLSVAGELGLLVAVNGVAHQRHQQDAEDEEHGEPDFPDHRGVVLDFRQETPQDRPVAHRHT
ncbi:hypothetical protein NL108_015136 [Boleophthalmus pectinirostris]|nr:hypothetical protein NL108_015136 [Boleophthalmus pectinirostris]